MCAAGRGWISDEHPGLTHMHAVHTEDQRAQKCLGIRDGIGVCAQLSNAPKHDTFFCFLFEIGNPIAGDTIRIASANHHAITPSRHHAITPYHHTNT
jgi:hypothetical protein